MWRCWVASTRSTWVICATSAAKELAGRGLGLRVILDSQEYLIKKGKGHPFYPTYGEREELNAIRWVDLVVPQIECSTARSLEHYLPKAFVKGGGWALDNLSAEEVDVCRRNGIEIVTGVGGSDEPQSSRWLIAGSKTRRV